MNKQHFHEIRSNTTFSVNYDDLNLVPTVELIFINVHPKYKVVTKEEKQFISKGHGLTETRIHCTLDQINHIIGNLQATAANLQIFQQMSVGLNKVIEQAKAVEQAKDTAE